MQNVDTNKKTKKLNCNYQNCNNYVVKLIGLCKLCNNSYCNAHRIYECHRCNFLIEFNEKEREKLKIKLLKESTDLKKIY